MNEPQRLVSLDVLRGITVAFMIMVNNNGDGNRAWWFMRHADWNGMTPTDLVFPTFLFVVGVSIVFAFASRSSRGVTPAQLARQTVQRAAVLFALGLVVNGFPYFHLETLRIYGVLQRIALCYCGAGLLHLWSGTARSKVLIAAALLLGYWVLMRWVPVPGSGLPGRDIALLDPDANLVAWLDRQLFSAAHLYERVRDPEGLLSTLPALATALIGMIAGLWLQTARSAPRKVAGLATAAAGLLLAGYVWSLWFPLNKKLWTSSYVLVAAGWSMLALMLCFWLIDVPPRHTRTIGLMVVFGSNAIAAYMISELLAILFWVIHWQRDGAAMSLQPFLYQHLFVPLGEPAFASFAYSVAFTALCFVPVWLLYRRGIFLKA
ncbi:MAG TPA: heparan-alpha-glucosaminide N-acetyltransferase domain-containing protein [Steroidobacteraceae bacterium]|nr:heparan-alpha-glucosaminide N-acetyltransferase domain-containing protein [Steroidobacteraceae bacterium]